jgi:hypothetical protein
LRVQMRRDPQVIQAEKEKKRADKEAKEKVKRDEVAKKEAAQKDLEEFRARQATNIKVDAAPRQQTKGIKLIILVPASHNRP